MPRSIHSFARRAALASCGLLVGVGGAGTASAASFTDNFTSFNTSTVWESATGAPNFVGPSDTVTATTLDGNSVVQLQSSMGNNQLKGYRTITTFDLTQPHALDLRFKPLSGGIDAEMELGLLNPANGNCVAIYVYAGTFGANRVWASSVRGSVTLNNDTSSGGGSDNDWQYDTYYRFHIDVTPTTTTVVARADDNTTVLYSHTFPVGTTTLGTNLKLLLAQEMGQPNSTQQTNGAADFLTLAQVPEPSLAWGLGLILAALTCRAGRPTRQCGRTKQAT